MILEDKILDNKEAFIASVKWLENHLLIPADWLMAVMYFESKLNPRAENPYSSAVGLLQWISSTAQSLGTSRAALLAMSNVEQLNYVYKYLLPYKGKIKSVSQLYLVVAAPAYLSSSDDTVLPYSAATVAANRVWNLNKDDKITVGEIKQFFKGFYDGLRKNYPSAIGGGFIVAALILAALTIKL